MAGNYRPDLGGLHCAQNAICGIRSGRFENRETFHRSERVTFIQNVKVRQLTSGSFETNLPELGYNLPGAPQYRAKPLLVFNGTTPTEISYTALNELQARVTNATHRFPFEPALRHDEAD